MHSSSWCNNISVNQRTVRTFSKQITNTAISPDLSKLLIFRIMVDSFFLQDVFHLGSIYRLPVFLLCRVALLSIFQENGRHLPHTVMFQQPRWQAGGKDHNPQPAIHPWEWLWFLDCKMKPQNITSDLYPKIIPHSFFNHVRKRWLPPYREVVAHLLLTISNPISITNLGRKLSFQKCFAQCMQRELILFCPN